MQTAVIPGKDLFMKFFNGEEVTIPVIVHPDWMDDFKKDKDIEVYHVSNTENYAHATGKITKVNGVVPSVPAGNPQIIAITVKRL